MRLTIAVVSALLLTVAVGPRQQPSRERPRDRRPRPVDARRPEVRPRLQALRLRQPGSAQGRQRQAGRHRHLRHPQPLHPQGCAGRRPRRDLRHAHGELLGRAVLPVRPGRREHRGAGRPFLGGLHAQAGSPLSRRQSHDGRGRHLDLRDAQGKGAALLPQLLRPGRQGREDRRPQGEVQLRAGREPRATADRRPAAGPFEGLVEQARLREDHPGVRRWAAPPTAWTSWSPAARSRTAGSRTTGERGCP